MILRFLFWFSFFFQIPFCIAFAIEIAAKESRNEILHMAPKAEILLSLGRLKGATIIDSWSLDKSFLFPLNLHMLYTPLSLPPPTHLATNLTTHLLNYFLLNPNP